MAYSEAANSPPHTPSLRHGGLSSFFPLSDEFVSTRGQRLSGLLHSSSQRPRSLFHDDEGEDVERDADDRRSAVQRKLSFAAREVLNTPQMRSMRLIGNSNKRYEWEQYRKDPEQLKQMKKPIRKYYERNNFLIDQYIYIDRLLDSSLPHNLLQEYHQPSKSTANIPQTISEESSPTSDHSNSLHIPDKTSANGSTSTQRIKRTPKALYKYPDEESPLLENGASEDAKNAKSSGGGNDDSVESNSPVVKLAIYINLAANAVLLAGKIVVIILTSSLSVLASLVDAALDFLSTAIVWTTTKLISRQNQYAYPVGRRRLEPIGVLVFSVIMMTAFFQVALQCFNRLTSGDHSIVQLSTSAIIIMASTVVIKFGCWFWSRLVKNSSVQALAQDAMTDVVFNIFSIIFPLVGYYAQIWYLDALGGLLLSLYVITNWSRTSASHIRNLTGAAASPDERNILLYLTMRFAKTIQHIQGLQAYHAGDKLNVEVDVVLDEGMSLRDSHDLGESLQYVLESVPYVDRAFVHLDYRSDNLPNHMQQQE